MKKVIDVCDTCQVTNQNITRKIAIQKCSLCKKHMCSNCVEFSEKMFCHTILPKVGICFCPWCVKKLTTHIHLHEWVSNKSSEIYAKYMNEIKLELENNLRDLTI